MIIGAIYVHCTYGVDEFNWPDLLMTHIKTVSYPAMCICRGRVKSTVSSHVPLCICRGRVKSTVSSHVHLKGEGKEYSVQPCASVGGG